MAIEPPIEEYGTQIGRILQQAQDASSDKQRLCTSLYNIHNAFTREYEKGLRDFFRCLFHRAFAAFRYKKGDVNADRTLKFLACYLDHCNTKYREEAKEKQEDEDEDEDSDDEDNAAEVKAAHFTKNIVKEVVFPGCEAGDKNVRFRTVQFMTFVAGSLQSIDEQLMIGLQQKLMDRLKDREAAVRSHAAIALGVLSHQIETGEGFEEQRLTTDESSSWRPLLEVLREDSIAEVRRSIISSIVINEATRPILLDTIQDKDASVRRAVYTVLRSNVENMTHPTRFSRPERNAVVHRALADQREPAVQNAAEQLLVSWLHVGPRKGRDTGPKETTPKILIETFISFFDLSAEYGLEMAEGSMKLVIKGDPQFFKTYLVAGSWQLENMNYQFVFAYRMFIMYLQEKQEAQTLEDMLPDIQPIAGAIQSIYNEMELEVQSTTWMLIELLKLGVHLDYSNVVMKAGVRKLMRMLLLYEVPDDLLRPVSHLLVTACDTQSSPLELLVEIVKELRTRDPVTQEDNTSDVETPSDKPDLSFEDQTKLDCVDKRCLTICIAVLECMDRFVGGNAARKAIKAIKNGIINPALLRSGPADLSFAALHCLGLCSTICLETADRYITYFEDKYFSNVRPEDDARVVMIKSYIDVAIKIQGTPVFTKHSEQLKRIMDKLLAQLPDEGGSEVGALICQGVAKFFLIGFVDDEDTLKLLFKAMISPSSVNNPNLRQSMQIFFWEFGRNHPSTQRRIQRIFTHIYLDACEDRRKYEQFESLDLKEKVDWVSSQSIAAMFERWTHPESLTKNAKLKAPNDQYLSLHLHMADDILRSLFGTTIKISKEDKRVLCHLLNRLYLPPSPDALQVKSIKFLIDNLRNRRPLNDRESNAALDKFDASIMKLYPRHIESMSEEDLRKHKELTDLFTFLDDMIPLDDDDELEPANAGDKRQRRGTGDTGSDGEYRSHSAPTTRSRSKRRRLSGDEIVVKEEQQDVKIENDDDGSLPPARPKGKGKARRTATSPEVISLLTEDEDEDAPPAWSNRKTRGTTSVEPVAPETESVVDRDLSKLLDPLSIATETDGVDMTMDSIMDESDFSQDSEDEVSGLLSTNDK